MIWTNTTQSWLVCQTFLLRKKSFFEGEKEQQLRGGEGK